MLPTQRQPVPSESGEEHACREFCWLGYAILTVVVGLARRNRHHFPRWGGAGVCEVKTLSVDVFGSSSKGSQSEKDRKMTRMTASYVE